MKTAKRSRVRPPRKIKDEPASVTIANQDIQIRNMIERVQALVIERDGWQRKYNSAMGDVGNKNSVIDGLQSQTGIMAEQIANMHSVITRMEGWRDCAREVLDLNCAEIDITRPMSKMDIIKNAMRNAGK